MEDRLMTVKQLSDYLNINERTVLKLVAEGTVPGVKVGNQWRFRKAMIDTWLDDQMLGLTPRRFETPEMNESPRKMLELRQCLKPSHILPSLEATTKTGVIEELAGLANELGLVRDRTWFVGALIERENVLPSATGNRIAFLHTLNRNPRLVTKPFLVLGRSSSGVDFDALDGQTTQLFFVLGLKYDVLHMPWLHKLSQMLAKPQAVKTLLAAPNADAIFEVLSKTEEQLVKRQT
jgi:PTS system nitrogen regulatory IIA component